MARVTPGSHTLKQSGEFLLVCADSDLASLMQVASRITKALAAPLELESGEVSIRASIGIATSDDGDASAESLIAAADTAMYVAKRSGDGVPVAYNPLEHAF
jgi:diguanylate cyclase (GGDEF)-like protein